MSDVIKNAIHAVLADDEIKKAILAYLKSITTEKKEEWREVYHCQSDIRKRDTGIDRITGMENVRRDFRLFMRVYYNDSGKVGKIVFFETDARLLDDRVQTWGYFESYELANDTILTHSQDFSEVIDTAISLWPEHKRMFESYEATE